AEMVPEKEKETGQSLPLVRGPRWPRSSPRVGTGLWFTIRWILSFSPRPGRGGQGAGGAAAKNGLHCAPTHTRGARPAAGGPWPGVGRGCPLSHVGPRTPGPPGGRREVAWRPAPHPPAPPPQGRGEQKPDTPCRTRYGTDCTRKGSVFPLFFLVRAVP